MITVDYKKLMATMAALFTALVLVAHGDVNADDVPPQIDVGVKADAGVPPAQRQAWVEENEARAKSIYRQVQGMLDMARQEKDSIKITCLDDKLTQIHVNLRGVEERKAALAAATAGGDSVTADQEFTVLAIYISRINGLQAEAESCIGDSDVVLGESETEVTVSDDVTQEDPVQDGQDVYVQVGVDQLPHASGYY